MASSSSLVRSHKAACLPWTAPLAPSKQVRALLPQAQRGKAGAPSACHVIGHRTSGRKRLWPSSGRKKRRCTAMSQASEGVLLINTQRWPSAKPLLMPAVRNGISGTPTTNQLRKSLGRCPKATACDVAVSIPIVKHNHRKTRVNREAIV